MNMTPEQLEQWKDACDALRDGEEIEYKASDMSWWPTTTISRCYPHRRKPIAPWSLSDHMRRFFPTWDEQTQPLHRTDWTEDELSSGVRSLLMDENRVVGLDEIFWDGSWLPFGSDPNHKHSDTNSLKGSCKTRTSRPLPTPPRMVPLTRADVPLHSVFRAPSGCDFLPMQISDYGIRISISGDESRSWSDLQNLGWLIHRPGDNNPDGTPAWRKCEKGAK